MNRKLMILAALLALLLAPPAFAQDDDEEGGGEEVIKPSEMQFTPEQEADVKKLIAKEFEAALDKCVAKHPRPEFFTVAYAEYKLKKSGKLNGGYIGGSAPDPNLYVKSDEERAKLEDEGQFSRMVMQNDRDVEKCLKKATGDAKSDVKRMKAKLVVTFEVTWKGKKPTVTAAEFTVER